MQYAKKECFLSPDFERHDEFSQRSGLEITEIPFVSNPRLKELKDNVDELWKNSNFITIKSRTAKMLELFPADLRIKQQVIWFDDKKALRETMEEMVKRGLEVGLRGCFSDDITRSLGTAPWVMGLKTFEQIAAFFGNAPSPISTPWQGATYDNWQKKHPMHELPEVIVMGNPPGLGDKKLKDKHFALRAEVFNGQFRIELRDKTPQLRDIEGETERRFLAEISMCQPNIGYGVFTKGDIYVALGKEYFDDANLKPGEIDLYKNRKISWNFKTAEMIKPQYKRLFSQVIDHVYYKWCGESFHFYYTLRALEKFGLGAIEFQGRHDEEGNIEWMLAYGLRGVKEKKYKLRR